MSWPGRLAARANTSLSLLSCGTACEAVLDKLRYVSLHTAGATAFIFVLNFFVLGTNLQTALIWAIGFGAMAFILARQHTRG
jgi:hypothetical protein